MTFLSHQWTCCYLSHSLPPLPHQQFQKIHEEYISFNNWRAWGWGHDSSFSLHVPSWLSLTPPPISESWLHSITGGFLGDVLTARTPNYTFPFSSHLLPKSALVSETRWKYISTFKNYSTHQITLLISCSFMERPCNCRLWAFSTEISV